LYNIFKDFKPNYIIDCINIPTQCSYIQSKDVFHTTGIGLHILFKYYQNLNYLLDNNFWFKKRIQMNITKYLKIGTTGIGGMGLNMPFTHGENKPSLPLLRKVAIAGAQTNILYAIKNNYLTEIKEIIPATAVFYNTFDCNSFHKPIKIKKSKKGLHLSINGGESGYYTLEEFRLLSNEKQMGFIDCKTLSKEIVDELFINKRNVLVGIEKYVIRSPKNIKKKRMQIIKNAERLSKKNNINCVAHGKLGPYKIRKLLFEAKIFRDYFMQNKKVFFIESNNKTSKKISVSVSQNKLLLEEIKYSGLYINYHKAAVNYRINKRIISDLIINLTNKNCFEWKKIIKLLFQEDKNNKLLAPGDIVSKLILMNKNELSKIF
jgi:hypothetical protein